jgi:hypothetical protein
MRRQICASLLAPFLFFLLPVLWAQATAQISGTVTDSTGAVLPGVEVTATQSIRA